MTAARSSAADAVLTAARGWLGTPYRHQASCRGVGADCLGLVRGVWREVLGAEPCAVPAYTPDWAEAGAPEQMLEAAERWLCPVAGAARPGDVLLFRMREVGPVKHAAILAEGCVPAGRMIHAYSGHAVCETSIGPAWGRRLARVFRFPETLPNPDMQGDA
ncbi:MAG: NlpC/P60 family protein [Pseudomonadota bacterium]